MSLNGRDPDWLNSLRRGDSPLLGRSELEYIAEVRRSIIREVESKPGFNDSSDLKIKLSVMKDNFAKIVEYLKENSSSKEYFLREYRNWKPVRGMTILQLKGIARHVNENSQKCSASRRVSSTVSLIGGIICFATGYGALRLLGASLMGLGGLASVGSSAKETEVLKEKIKEAEKIIEEDRKCSVKLWVWISDGSYIQEALNTIKNIKLDDNIKKVASDLHSKYNMNWCPDNVKMYIKLMIFQKVSPEIINEFSEVIGILIATFMLYDRYGKLFNQALETYKCNKILSTACNVIMTTFKVSSAFNVRNSLKLTTLQKSSIITGIVLDALSIIDASEGEESRSKEAIEIDKAVEKLKEEADVFEKLYYHIS